MEKRLGNSHPLKSNEKAPRARIFDIRDNHIHYELVDQTDGVVIGIGKLHKLDFDLKFGESK